jgi:hypothetical protein
MLDHNFSREHALQRWRTLLRGLDSSNDAIALTTTAKRKQLG